MKKTLLTALMLSASLSFGGWSGNTFFSNNASEDQNLKDSDGHYTTLNITSSSIVAPGSDASATFNEINVGSNASLEFGTNTWHTEVLNNQTVTSLNLADKASIKVTNGQVHVTNLTASGSASFDIASGTKLDATDIHLSSGTMTLSKDTVLTANRIKIDGGANVTLVMEEGARITTQQETTLSSLSTALTLNTKTAESAIEDAVSTEGFYTRVLLESVNETIWFSNGNGDAHNSSITLSDSMLDAAGFEYLGVLFATDDALTFTDSKGETVVMNGKQYALVYSGNGSTYANGKAPKTLMLVATPEPATATLSLLALAALASRRRRH